MKENFMDNKIKNATPVMRQFWEAKASYPQVMKIAMHFSKLTKCPKDIKFGTLRGHFLAKLNDAKKPLTNGQVSKLLTLKAVPASDLKSMRAYKDFQSS